MNDRELQKGVEYYRSVGIIPYEANLNKPKPRSEIIHKKALRKSTKEKVEAIKFEFEIFGYYRENGQTKRIAWGTQFENDIHIYQYFIEE